MRTEGLNPQHSRKLLERFLSSTEFQQPRATSPWEKNPLLQELARSVKTPADFEYIEGLLREDDRHSVLVSTLHSMRSTGTINSSRGSEITRSGSSSSINGSFFSTQTSTTMETSLSRMSHGICEEQLSQNPADDEQFCQHFDDALLLRCQENSKLTHSLDVSEIEPADDQVSMMHPKASIPLKNVEALQRFDGVWEFKKHPKSDIAHLHRVIDLDKSQIKKNLEHNSNFEVQFPFFFQCLPWSSFLGV